MDILFKKIVEIPSISGEEEQLNNFLDQELKDTVDKIYKDPLGNNIKQIGNGNNKLMLEAHADEVGFIITYVDKNGFAYFKPLGGIKKDIAVGQKVKIYTKNGVVTGIIGRDPEKPVTSQSSIKETWIDTGSCGKSINVQIGDMVYFDTYFEELKDDYILARGADNKVGVYIVSKIAKSFSKHINNNLTLFCVLTTQEEIGMYGAKVADEQVKPKYSFIIETTDATDTPGADVEGQGEIVLGKGPVITFSPKTDDNLFTLFKETAQKHNIPLQIIAQAKETSTDTDVIQSSNGGVITMLISIAVRYMHTPLVLFNWQDVEFALKLINLVLPEIGKINF